MRTHSHLAIRSSALVLAYLLVTACGQAQPHEAQAFSHEDQSIVLDQLSSAVEIRIDPYGMAHITAQSEADLFFAQGFNAARDRLWQIDFWRRAGLGEMSEAFGPDYVDRDRAARLFLYHGDLDAEWAAYGDSAHATATAFVAGINAYIEWARQAPGRLPPEFTAIGYTPAKWSVDDLVRIRSHGVWQNVYSEVVRSIMACNGLLEADELRNVLEPARELQIPDGFDPCDIPDDVLDVYELVSYPPKLVTGGAGGSNNWAISGDKTASGRPILASDPHRAYTIPALRYGVHLKAPGINVIGAGEPHAPGIALGHNGKVAFGFTIFPADQEDLVVLELHPTDSGLYKEDDQWAPIWKQSTEIAVRGSAAQTVDLEFSKYGPIIHRSADASKAFALRSVAFETGATPYFGQLQTMRASGADGYETALKSWGSPGEHHVFADADQIAWRSAARTPVRTNHDGLFPVPAGKKYDWVGYRTIAELPGGRDPARGWIATANNIQDADNYPYAEKGLSFEWIGDWRARRISEVLGANSDHTIEQSLALQSDHVSVFARELIAVLASANLKNRSAIKVRDRLQTWDKEISADSTQAALYQIWYYGHVDPMMIARAGAEDMSEGILLADERFILEQLRNPQAVFWGDDPVHERDLFLDKSLANAQRDTGLLFFGQKQKDRIWGSLLTARWKHLAHDLLPKGLQARFQLREVARGGDLTTPGFALFNENFDLLYGASWRMVIDVGDWDKSVFINAPGQSGDPRSRHFNDHYETWAVDGALPLLYSEAALAETEMVVITLLPSDPPR